MKGSLKMLRTKGKCLPDDMWRHLMIITCYPVCLVAVIQLREYVASFLFKFDKLNNVVYVPEGFTDFFDFDISAYMDKETAAKAFWCPERHRKYSDHGIKILFERGAIESSTTTITRTGSSYQWVVRFITVSGPSGEPLYSVGTYIVLRKEKVKVAHWPGDHMFVAWSHYYGVPGEPYEDVEDVADQLAVLGIETNDEEEEENMLVDEIGTLSNKACSSSGYSSCSPLSQDRSPGPLVSPDSNESVDILPTMQPIPCIHMAEQNLPRSGSLNTMYPESDLNAVSGDIDMCVNLNPDVDALDLIPEECLTEPDFESDGGPSCDTIDQQIEVVLQDEDASLIDMGLLDAYVHGDADIKLAGVDSQCKGPEMITLGR